jgi:hypothetical protein
VLLVLLVLLPLVLVLVLVSEYASRCEARSHARAHPKRCAAGEPAHMIIEGYADIESQTKLTPGTLFRGASITKV